MPKYLIVGMTLAEGILVGLIALWLYQRNRAWLANCDWLWGEVVEIKEKPGEDGTMRHPVIRYETLNGQQFTFESRYGRAKWDIKPGDKLQIVVDRNDPTDAHFAGFLSLWALPLFLGIGAAISLIAAVICFVVIPNPH